MTGSRTDELDAIGPQLVSERPFAARIRFHQSWYRRFVLEQVDFGRTRPPLERALGSILTPDAADEGLNFTSASARNLYISRRAQGWGVDPVRCTSYLTSSQTLSLNLLGPLVGNPVWAAGVFRSATGRGDITRIRSIDLEVPARRLGLDLGDKTHIDALIRAETRTGTINIALEVKFGDRFNSRVIDVHRRAEYQALSAIWHDPNEALRTPALNQLVRCHSIAAALSRQSGSSTDEAFLLLVHFPGDHEAESIAQLYADSLSRSDSFRAVPLDQFLAQMAATATVPRDSSVSEALSRRYLAHQDSEPAWARYTAQRKRRKGPSVP